MKQNDWIIANVNNPEFTIADFQNIADMSTENTQLLDYKDYLKKDFIKNNDLFKDKNGNFNEDLFKNYYISKAQEFQQFHENDYLDKVDYSIWDVRRTRDSEVKNPNLQFVTVHNPDRVAMGIEGLNVLSDPSKTISEIAQTQKIWDPEKGEFLDYTPNDKALFKEGNIFKNTYNYITSLFDDPLVIARYEEDGTHIEYGREVAHKKGQYKLNEDGTYYSEKLNGRSVVGKEFISALDTITIDDSKANKYDFFDADGLDKSAIGSTVKNLVTAAPLYFLGPTGAAVYGGIFVARELAKSLPMLADVVTLFGKDQDSQLLNTIAAYGNKFTGSTSEYAKQHMFSYENFANLATDVALQWAQQKAIANSIKSIIGGGKGKLEAAYAKAAKTYTDEAASMLNKGLTGQMPLNEVQSYIGTSIDRLSDIKKLLSSGEWEKTPLGAAALRKFLPEAEEFIAKRTKLGQDLSLAYMAIISNTDVYEDVLQHGGTKKEAAAMALGSMIGMYSVDKFLGLGELFFDDVDEQRIFRNATIKEADNVMTTIGGTLVEEAEETTKGLAKWIKRGVDSGKKIIRDYKTSMKDKTLGIIGKSFGEGLEEVSEELVADFSKTLGELAGEFGIASQTDYGAWDNPLERYTMSFLGGAVGGAMFYGINGPSNQKTEEELIYLIRNNKTKDVLEELDKLHKKGKLASTTLSWKTSEGGVYISADENNESQNDYVYKRLKESIIQMDNIINENKLSLNEDQLFDKLVLSEARYAKLRDYLQDASYVTGYQQEYQNIISDLKRIDDSIAKLNAETADTERKNSSYVHALEELEAERQQIIDKRDKFLNGEYSAHYLKKMLFAIDTNLSEPYISLTYEQFVRHNYGKNAKYLTEDENTKFREEYEKYNTNSKKKGLSEAFRIYEEMEQELIPIVEGLNEQDVISWGKIAHKLEKESPLRKLHSWDDKLESETEEEFNNRNTQMDGEGDAQFNLRKSLRAKAIEEFNNQNLQKWYDDFIQGQGVVDQGTYRKLLGSLSQRKKDLYNHYKSNIYTLPVEAGEFDLTRNTKLTKEIFEILNGLKEDNTDEIREQIEKKINASIREELENLYKEQRDIFRNSYDFKGGDADVDAQGNVLSQNFNSIEGPLTKQHIFDYFTRVLQLYGISSENPEEIKEFLLNTPTDDYFGVVGGFYDMAGNNVNKWIDEYVLHMFPNSKEIAAIDFALAAGTITQEEANLQKSAFIIDTTEQLEMTDEEFENKFNEVQESAGKAYLASIDKNILKAMQKDPWLKTIQDFEQKLKVDANPVIQLLKVTNPRLGKNPGLEQQLEEIQEIWDNLDNPVDFELSAPQVDALKEAVQQLNYVKTFIYSASAIPNFVNPVGHNRALNEFAKKHSDKVVDWNPLPELGTDVSNVYLSEIDRYIQEADFWIAKAYENSVNKKEEFKQTDRALLKTRLDFYKNNKFTLSDGTNLLEGWNNDDESLSNLVAVDDVLYNNFQKAVKAGRTEEDILGELIETITKVDNIAQQITTPINRELSYAKYSDYDKFTQLVSVLATKDSNFYNKVKSHIADNPTTKDGNKIASLSVQEYAERVVEASLKNPNFINKALEVVNSKSSIKLPIVKNATLITGLGGAGKTDVVVRASVSDIDPKSIWVSGPTDAQVLGLQQVIKGSTGISRYDLMSQIMGKEEYDKFLSELEKERPNIKYFKKEDVGEERVFRLIKSGIKFLDVDKKPKVIVIDEVTHFSGMELQLLGEWANQNDVNLILVGDENQKGFEGPGLNVDREKLLLWRAPRLGVSLRDATYQKVKNLQQVVNILEDLRTSLHLSPEKLHEVYNQQIPGIDFKYYIDDEKFSGELITKDITPNITKLLKGKVGYVGQEDDVYKALKDQGVDVQLFPSDKIQGREFDYVVINKNWKAPEQDNTGVNSYRFLQDLYTMMSRSKEGTVFIDNGLSDIIGNKQETVYARVTSVREAAGEFNEYKLKELENIKIEEATKLEEPEKELEDSEKELEQHKKELKEFPVNPEVDTGEEEQQKQIRNEKSTNINYPIRVYGNVHLLGVANTLVVVNRKKKHEWENKNNSHQDIGIFLKPGEKITDGKKKDELVRKLLNLKSVILFGTQNHAALDVDLATRFTKEAFDNIEYYIQVRDNDHLIGMTNLDQDKLKLNDKVITIVGKIKDNTGEDYYITLGALASPDTWEKNKNNIIHAVKKRLEEEHSEDLQKYVDNFDGIIQSYRNRLSELSKRNQEVRIKKPDFTAMTELIFNDSDGNELPNIRLEEIDSDIEPWTMMNPYAIVSDNYVLIDDIPGSNLKKGTTVRYVTANTLLSSDQLEEKYWNQKTEGGIPQVRLQVLRNEGVSFRSLYAKSYKDLYTAKIGSNLLTFPINLKYQAMNMYRSMWNFRANLSRFNERLKIWMSERDLTDAQVEELIKLDAQEYAKISKDLGVKHLSEKEYREKSEKKDKLKVLWDFNDSLSDSVRQFRLGYSAQNGAYLRRLTNITVDNQFYQGIKDPVGIYITPDLANYYETTLNSLFEKFLNKLVSNPLNTKSYIDELQDGWFNELKSGKIKLKLYDIQDGLASEYVETIEVAGAEKLKAIPVLLTEMAKYMNYYSQDKDGFSAVYGNEVNEDDGSIKQGLFKVMLGDEEINYIDIFDPEGNVIYETKDGTAETIPGVHTFTTKEGAEQTMDFRLNNLWDLMFHGSIENAAKNDFTNVEWVATDAYFKNGISHEPLMFARKGDANEEKHSVAIASSKKFFSTDTGVGFPLLYVDLEEYTEETSEEIVKIEETDVTKNFTLTQENANTLLSFGLTNKELEELNGIEEAINLVNKKIKNKINRFFQNGNESTQITQIPYEAKLDEFGNIRITYLTDAYPELKDGLETQEWIDQVLTLKKKDGKHMTVQYNEGEIIISNPKQNSVNDDTTTGQEIVNILQSFVETYKDAFKSPDPDILSDEEVVEDYINGINKAFEKYDLSRSLNDTDLATALNAIDNELIVDNSLELNHPYNKAINQMKTAIIELKQRYCRV